MVNYYINNERVERISFPTTEIGTKSTITVMVENEWGEDVELIPYVGDMEVNVKEYPRRLLPGEKKKSVWTFSPTEKRLKFREGMPRQISLDCECGFKEIIGPTYGR